MENENKISLNRLDALREVGSIGAGRAATALADMLNCRVEICLPETKVVPLESLDRILGDPEETYYVLDIALEGDLGGRVFFLLPPKEVKFLAEALLGSTVPSADINDPLFQSSLKEMVNILTGAYMNVLADMTSFSLMYGVPSLAVDMVGALLDFFFIQIAQYSDEAIFIKTQFSVKNINFSGMVLIFFDFDSLRKLFETLKVED